MSSLHSVISSRRKKSFWSCLISWSLRECLHVKASEIVRGFWGKPAVCGTTSSKKKKSSYSMLVLHKITFMIRALQSSHTEKQINFHTTTKQKGDSRISSCGCCCTMWATQHLRNLLLLSFERNKVLKGNRVFISALTMSETKGTLLKSRAEWCNYTFPSQREM